MPSDECKFNIVAAPVRKHWLAKLNGNAARDKIHQGTLRKLGWRVIVIWECEAAKQENLSKLLRRLTGRVPQR